MFKQEKSKATTAWLILVGFTLLVFLVYYHSLFFDFVRWDDGLLIYENPAIRAITPATLRAIFTHYDPELYIPLTFLSYQLNFLIGGTNPVIYHLTNLLLHIANAVLVFLLTRHLLARNQTSSSQFSILNSQFSISLFTALLFAVHPLQTEAVVWASARKDVLSTFFFLLSLFFYLKFNESGRKRTYVAGIGAFTLGLLSKVVIVTLPVVLVLIDYLTGRPINRKTLQEKLPYFALAILFIAIALIGKRDVLASATLVQTVLMAGRSTVFYLQKLVVPTDLSVLYPYTGEIAVTNPDFLLPLALVAALIAIAIGTYRRFPVVTFGITFYLLTLAPTFTNFAKGGDFYVASDRYAYIPSIGIFLIASFVAALIHQYINILMNERPAPHRRALRVAGAALLAIVIAVLASLSFKQSTVWANSETLFRNVIAHYPNSHRAWNNLGNIHRRRDENEQAIAAFEKALQTRDHPRTRSNLGAVLRKQGKIAEAIEQYDLAFAVDPNAKEAHFGMGIIRAQQGQRQQAELSYERALTTDPTYVEVRLNLGALHMQQGNFELALEQYDEAIRILPFFAEAHYNRGVVLQKLKRNRDAMQAYERAVTAEPSFVAARINLAILYHTYRRIDEAVDQFRAVLRYDPDNMRARSALKQLGAM